MLYAADVLPRVRVLESSITAGHHTELWSALLVKRLLGCRSVPNPMTRNLHLFFYSFVSHQFHANLTLAYCIHKIRHTGLERLKAWRGEAQREVENGTW